MLNEAINILFSVVLYLGIPALVIYLIGESFFRKRKNYKRSKEADGVSVIDRISLVVHGIVFFSLLTIFILVFVVLALIFTGVMKFM